jgi:hypothetical protein
MTEEDILRNMIRENQKSRARFQKLSARTSEAILSGDVNEFGNIVRDATRNIVTEGAESSAQPVETGDANGDAGNQVTAGPPADVAEESGS